MASPLTSEAPPLAERSSLATPAALSRGGLARATVSVSIMTGLSRLAGLGREILASSYFGTRGAFSAFTIAFQLPNLARSLVTDSALSAALIPVFTELLQQGRKREAFRLAATLFWAVALIFTAATCVFILAAGSIMPLLVGPKFSPHLVHLTIGLARVLFPTVVFLGLNGLLVGVLAVYGRFTLPAFAGVAWNLTVIAALFALRRSFHGDQQLYAYAIGVFAGALVQLSIALAALRSIDFRLAFRFDWRNSRMRQVLRLMLPVTVALGIVDVDSLINSALGTLVSDQAPRAIEAAFRIYMLPQGLLSIPVTTVLFPTMGRLAARRDAVELARVVDAGLRQLAIFIVPAAAFMIALALPIVRLIYQHGSFGAQSTALVSEALVWFAVSLPFAAGNLLLTRTFFALQRPWVAGRITALNLVVDLAVSVALYKPLGIAGLVIGTVVASALMFALQFRALNRGIDLRRELDRFASSLGRVVVAAVLLAGVSWLVATLLDGALGRSPAAQIMTVGVAALAGIAIYAGAVFAMRVPEARDIARAAVSRWRAA